MNNLDLTPPPFVWRLTLKNDPKPDVSSGCQPWPAIPCPGNRSATRYCWHQSMAGWHDCCLRGEWGTTFVHCCSQCIIVGFPPESIAGIVLATGLEVNVMMPCMLYKAAYILKSCLQGTYGLLQRHATLFWGMLPSVDLPGRLYKESYVPKLDFSTDSNTAIGCRKGSALSAAHIHSPKGDLEYSPMSIKFLSICNHLYWRYTLPAWWLTQDHLPTASFALYILSWPPSSIIGGKEICCVWCVDCTRCQTKSESSPFLFVASDVTPYLV